MRSKRIRIAIVALCFAGVGAPKRAAADEWDRRTLVTFSQDVELSGTLLPAGTYIFKLADSRLDRHTVQVLDLRGNVITTVITIAAVRSTPTHNTTMTFDENAPGSPHPIKAWFYAGRLDGEEFLRPNRARSATTD